MKKVLTKKELRILGSVGVFVGLYVAGLIYTGWHSKQGNLWLLILESLAFVLVWPVYLYVIKLNSSVFGARTLGALPVYAFVGSFVLALCHLFGFLAKEPEAQQAWAYSPYVVALVLAAILFLMRGAERHRDHPV